MSKGSRDGNNNRNMQTHTKIVSGEDYNKRREAANDTREERLLALIWRALEGTQRHTHRQKN